MPHMRTWPGGIKWHLATDDLPLPMFLGGIFHLCWAIALVVVLPSRAFTRLSPACRHGSYASHSRALNGTLIALCCVYGALVITDFAIVLYCARGTVLEARKRRFTQLLLGMVFGCHVASAVLTSAATAYHAIATRTRPPHCHRPTVGISALIISAWVILGLFILAISVLFGSLPGAGAPRVWRRRMRVLSVLCCCPRTVRQDIQEVVGRPMGAQLTSAKSAMGSAGGGQGAMRPGEEQKESADEQPWGSRSVVERLTVIAWQALGKLDLTLSDVAVAMLLLSSWQQTARLEINRDLYLPNLHAQPPQADVDAAGTQWLSQRQRERKPEGEARLDPTAGFGSQVPETAGAAEGALEVRRREREREGGGRGGSGGESGSAGSVGLTEGATRGGAAAETNVGCPVTEASGSEGSGNEGMGMVTTPAKHAHVEEGLPKASRSAGVRWMGQGEGEREGRGERRVKEGDGRGKGYMGGMREKGSERSEGRERVVGARGAGDGQESGGGLVGAGQAERGMGGGGKGWFESQKRGDFDQSAYLEAPRGHVMARIAGGGRGEREVGDGGGAELMGAQAAALSERGEEGNGYHGVSEREGGSDGSAEMAGKGSGGGGQESSGSDGGGGNKGAVVVRSGPEVLGRLSSDPPGGGCQAHPVGADASVRGLSLALRRVPDSVVEEACHFVAFADAVYSASGVGLGTLAHVWLRDAMHDCAHSVAAGTLIPAIARAVRGRAAKRQHRESGDTRTVDGRSEGQSIQTWEEWERRYFKSRRGTEGDRGAEGEEGVSELDWGPGFDSRRRFTRLRRADVEAVAMKAKIGFDDLVYASFEDSFLSKLPYIIALSPGHKAVVLALRGTASVEDIVTDVFGDVAPMSDLEAFAEVSWRRAEAADAGQPQGSPEPPRIRLCSLTKVGERRRGGDGSGWDRLAHGGFVLSAVATLRDIDEKGILRRVLSGQCTCPVTRWLRQRGVSESHGWRLVLTGHSLGGAVAALLAAALRPRYPSLRCWAVAPPGGTADPATAASWSLFVTTVVVGKDLVPRMSLWSLEQMQSRMVELLARSRLGKTGVFLAYMRGYLLDPERAFMPMEEVPEEARAFLDRFRSRAERIHVPEMHIPGKVILVRPVKCPKQASGPTRAAQSMRQWLSKVQWNITLPALSGKRRRGGGGGGGGGDEERGEEGRDGSAEGGVGDKGGVGVGGARDVPAGVAGQESGAVKGGLDAGHVGGDVGQFVNNHAGKSSGRNGGGEGTGSGGGEGAGNGGGEGGGRGGGEGGDDGGGRGGVNGGGEGVPGTGPGCGGVAPGAADLVVRSARQWRAAAVRAARRDWARASFQAVWADAAELCADGVLIAPSMMHDHSTHTYNTALRTCLADIQEHA